MTPVRAHVSKPPLAIRQDRICNLANEAERRIAEMPRPLTCEQEAELAMLRGDLRSLFNELVHTLDPWIRARAVWFVRRFHLTPEDIEDLRSEGRLAVLRARKTYDPAHGCTFLTYAAYWINHRMQRWVRENGLVHVPCWVQEAGARTKNMMANLDLSTHRAACTIAAHRRYQPVRLDALIDPGDDGSSTRFNFLPDPQESAEDRLAAESAIEEGRRVFALALDRLTDRERHVIEGLVSGQKPREIGETLGTEKMPDGRPVSRERVRQLKESAALKIRRAVFASTGIRADVSAALRELHVSAPKQAKRG